MIGSFGISMFSQVRNSWSKTQPLDLDMVQVRGTGWCSNLVKNMLTRFFEGPSGKFLWKTSAMGFPEVVPEHVRGTRHVPCSLFPVPCSLLDSLDSGGPAGRLASLDWLVPVPCATRLHWENKCSVFPVPLVLTGKPIAGKPHPFREILVFRKGTGQGRRRYDKKRRRKDKKRRRQDCFINPYRLHQSYLQYDWRLMKIFGTYNCN